jgi:flavin-dependent dehydrogenase
MESREVIIVGGGPAGSSCAARLRERGIEPLILDAETFPRLKLCAGWITPEVVRALDLDPAAYPHRFLTFDRLRIHLRGFGFSLNDAQHSIRRVEFDDWLLRRSGAEIRQHNVRRIVRDGDGFVIDGQYRSKYLVGAAGTKCPVFRELFRDANPRARELQAVALEEEFAFDWQDPDCHLWFFENGFPGYAWYVPKRDGFLNIGIGGMASQLKVRNEDIKSHWARLVDRLDRMGLVRGHAFEPAGYSYYLRADVQTVKLGNAFLVGDSAGLATRDMCEGIGPAIFSGQRAADAIADGKPYTLDGIARFSISRPLFHKTLEYFFVAREQRRLKRAA